MRRVYLDHAATTPLDPPVLEAMVPHLREGYGNPSSVHALGRKARVALEEARAQVAAVLGAEPGEVVFTSGGTEANNTVLRSVLGRAGPTGHLVTSAAEHEAVLQPAEALAAAGHPVTVLAPRPHGAAEPDQVDEALRPGTVLVSLMHANNELGTLTAVEEVADRCRARSVLVHCDAVQTAGLYALDVEALGVDFLSLSGHKFYGPKGVGVLYVRGGVDLDPLVRGGSQERGRRGGTENVAAVAGLAEALRRAAEAASERAARIAALRDRMVESVRAALPAGSFVVNTPLGSHPVAPHIVNLAFPPHEGRAVDGEMLLLNLDVEGVCASAGSACTSGALSPSHVLSAIGLPRETASAAVRFSLGKDTTEEDVDYAVDALARVLKRMRR